MPKTRSLTYSGPADHWIIALQRLVQPGDELKLTDEELGQGQADAIADGLLAAYGFSESKSKGGKD